MGDINEVRYRWLDDALAARLPKPFVHVLFGARQTGKTTLLRHLLPQPALSFDLADPAERNHLLADIGAFTRACRALPRRKPSPVILVDEAQTVPAVFAPATARRSDHGHSVVLFVMSPQGAFAAE